MIIKYNINFNKFTAEFYKKKIMDKRNKVDLILTCNNPISMSKKYVNQEYTISHFNDIKSCENIFLWLDKFNNLMCSSVGHRSYELLKHLLFLYTQ